MLEKWNVNPLYMYSSHTHKHTYIYYILLMKYYMLWTKLDHKMMWGLLDLNAGRDGLIQQIVLISLYHHASDIRCH